MRLPKEYEERFCAYVDILGFRELIVGVRRGDVPFNRVKQALRAVHKPVAANLDGYEDSDFRAQSISDAVVISTAPSSDGLSHLFYALEHLTLQLLYEGFLLRGAIVHGRLYHRDQTVFGDALVN